MAPVLEKSPSNSQGEGSAVFRVLPTALGFVSQRIADIVGLSGRAARPPLYLTKSGTGEMNQLRRGIGHDCSVDESRSVCQG